MEEQAAPKSAKKVYTFEDIKFNEENKVMAIVSCIPLIGLIMLFVEKNDQFVRYMGAQFALVGVLQFFIWIPIIGWLLLPVTFVMIIIGMVKSAKGERFDVPVISGLALKLMGAV
jgi:uncharacterized membrane protein